VLKDKQLQLRSYLDQQVMAKSEMVQSRGEETRMLRKQMDDDHQRLLEEEQKKKDILREKVAVLKEDRQEQVLTTRINRELERKERLEAGQQIAREANLALQSERDAALEKKRREKEMQQKLIDEWQVEQKEHQEKQKVEHAAERQAVLKLQEELRKEEEQKAMEIQKELAKREEVFQQLANAEALAKKEKKIKREARIQEENRSLEHVRKANSEMAEREKQKQAQKRADRVQNVDFLFHQMGENQRIKSEEEDRKVQLLSTVRSATDQYAEEERQRAADKRARNVQHRLQLEQQISSRVKVPPRVREDLMSTSEAFINKNIVGEAGRYGLF
jgi:hypothetical protein